MSQELVGSVHVPEFDASSVDYSAITPDSVIGAGAVAANGAVGSTYANSICIGKAIVNLVIKVCDGLSKVAIDTFAHNVSIISDNTRILFRYNNGPTLFEYSCSNASGTCIMPICLSLSTFKKLSGLVASTLVLVEKDGKVYIDMSGRLVLVDTLPYDSSLYNFSIQSDVDKHALDVDLAKKLLPIYLSLMGVAERNSEKLIITHDDFSYIQVGSVLGRSMCLLGPDDSVVSRVFVDSISVLLPYVTSASVACIDDAMIVSFDTAATLRIPVTTGSRVANFTSKMFENAFTYNKSVSVNCIDLKQLLTAFVSLSNFAQDVKLTFGESTLLVEVQNGDSKYEYEFKYLSTQGGRTLVGSINVEISVLLAVLSVSVDTPTMCLTNDCLLIDSGYATFCVRGYIGTSL